MKPRGWVSYRNILGLLVDALDSYEIIIYELFSHFLDVLQESRLGKEVLHSCNSNILQTWSAKEKVGRGFSRNIYLQISYFPQF